MNYAAYRNLCVNVLWKELRCWCVVSGEDNDESKESHGVYRGGLDYDFNRWVVCIPIRNARFPSCPLNGNNAYSNEKCCHETGGDWKWEKYGAECDKLRGLLCHKLGLLSKNINHLIGNCYSCNYYQNTWLTVGPTSKLEICESSPAPVTEHKIGSTTTTHRRPHTVQHLHIWNFINLPIVLWK